MATVAENVAAGPRERGVLAGRALSALALAALALDATAKLVLPGLMAANTPAQLGMPADPALYRVLGGILLIGIALHLWRRTALLGAVWITAFLGGAVAVNLRAEMPLFSNTLFGAYLGVLLWAGFWLRDARIRAFVG